MKKFLAVASATMMLSGVAGVATAHHRADHDQNYHGMCTAYFSGSEKGQENKRANGNAFGSFESTVGDFDDDGDTDAYDVAAFCNDRAGGYGNPGQGNEPFFPEDATPNEDCEECDYTGGTGTGSNDGKGNGKSKG